MRFNKQKKSANIAIFLIVTTVFTAKFTTSAIIVRARTANGLQRSVISLDGAGSDYFVHITRTSSNVIEDVAIHSPDYNAYVENSIGIPKSIENYPGTEYFLVGFQSTQLVLYQFGTPIIVDSFLVGHGYLEAIYHIPKTNMFIVGDT